MKIAFVCTEKLPVPPILSGAIQIYITNLLPILSKYHDITVFSLRNDKLKDEEQNGNITHIRVAGRTKAEYVNNIKERLTDEFDLVHVFNRPKWIKILSSNLPNTPFSLSLHNEMFLPKKIDAKRAKECIDRVEFICTVSEFIANGVQNPYPNARGKMNAVYSAVDLNLIKPFWSEGVLKDRIDMRKKYGVADNAKVIIYVGRLSKKKGPDVLIKAMKSVLEDYPDTKLIFVGSKWYGNNATDDYVKNLQAEAKELKDNIAFTGFLTPDEIPKYYNMGDMFVCTSQWQEPLARVHYEAMASALPMITTNRGGNAEVINQGVNGFAIDDYTNPDEFSKYIKYFIENEEKAIEMGKKGRKFVEEHHNWNVIANRLLRLFGGVAKKYNKK
ncbi:MAG: glycosyltransferase family 4 protein [Tepidibacter sp.]|jgi:spore coat protein SA|uniref:glycosyltransferase family 4 protein n=1 Tax=Tepidibacter sp. TaxID=2529387 RepID=UPI0025CBC763|nr:glycosyltransferase family 4 protein [Tepidibacter sp.]MCT4508419.1 glycosyltransferase family 4 protein [Tepidibacter sp.]